MALPSATIPIAYVRGMLSAQSCDRQCDDLLSKAGISPQLLTLDTARVTAAQYIALFQTVVVETNDEGLGFFSRPLRIGTFSMLARSAQSGDTLDAAMRRVSHTFGLLQDDIVLEPMREGSLAGLALHFVNASNPKPPFLQELLLRVFWRLLAWLVGGRLKPVRFDFAFEHPVYASRNDKVFPARQRFNQQRSALFFDAARLQSRILRDEDALRTFLENATSHFFLPPRSDALVSELVRRHLQQRCPDWPALELAAEALHMSASTLQRRLATERTSFQMVKDKLRRDIAIARLGAGTSSLQSIADELGFSDSANFQRAFKHWTGSPPGGYRRTARGDVTAGGSDAAPAPKSSRQKIKY